jgi:antitoxin (DNA-binding transcriptional repressor) of toxin-antitoxin stability system
MITSASATLLNREPSKVLGRAERGETIFVEKFGEPTAVMIPHPRRTSGADLARRLKLLKPMPRAAAAVENFVKGMDDASRRAFNID